MLNQNVTMLYLAGREYGCRGNTAPAVLPRNIYLYKPIFLYTGCCHGQKNLHVFNNIYRRYMRANGRNFVQ